MSDTVQDGDRLVIELSELLAEIQSMGMNECRLEHKTVQGPRGPRYLSRLRLADRVLVMQHIATGNVDAIQVPESDWTSVAN